MRTSNAMGMAGGITLAVLLSAAQARAIIAYDFPSGLAGNLVGSVEPGPWILGNVFSVNSAINVTAVGAFASESGYTFGAGVTVPVAVYSFDGANWSQVNGTYREFSAANLGTLNGSARFQTLDSPVILQPGTYAIMAANYGIPGANGWDLGLSAPGDSVPAFQTTTTAIEMASPLDPYIALFRGGQYHPDFGATLDLTFPADSFITWGSGSTPYFAGATFAFDLTPVPEAAAFGAAAVGLLGLVYLGRYARLRCRTKLP
jgi:hypothetical protein